MFRRLLCLYRACPSPNEVTDNSNEEKRWKVGGPALNRRSSSSVLWDCCRYGDAGALRELLESGAVTVEEMIRRDVNGRTALYLACDAHHTECIRLLLAFDGINANSKISSTVTATNSS